MRPSFVPLLAALLAAAAAGCTRPPASSYFGGGPETSGSAVTLGNNASGEACTQQARGGGSAADIFCGTWTQPSGHAERGGATAGADLATLAASGAWRQALDAHYLCGPPASTTISGGFPAIVMQCARKIGGWPQTAVVADIGGTAYYGDAIEPAFGVLERSLGVLSGKLSADAANVAQRSPADGLFAARLAAQAFSAGNIAQYEQLMLQGTDRNLVEDFPNAESDYRAATALQEKALGRNDPNTGVPLTYLALQVSNQGRFAEADSLFARASSLVGKAADPTAAARLLHYEGLNALNQSKYTDALDRLRRADTAYAAFLPASTLAKRPVRGTPLQVLASSGGGTRNDPLPREDLILDPTEQAALIGVIETRRNQAIALRNLDRKDESDAAIVSAMDIASSHGMRTPKLSSRLFRTAATTSRARGQLSDAISGMTYSSAAFRQAFPGTRPVAATKMLVAAQLHARGDDGAALGECRDAVVLLRSLRSGIAESILQPCLEVYDTQASGSSAQDLRAEMFEAAQLAEGNVTSEIISNATARLAENARDPRVGAAVRRRQDAKAALDDLTGQRDSQSNAASTVTDIRPRVDADELEKRIGAARSELSDAESALESASPNFPQLVQEATPATAVFAALGANEAFALITLGNDGGWVFVLRDGKIDVAKMSNGRAGMAALVKRLRSSIEPGEDAKLPAFDSADAAAIYSDTLGRLDASLSGAKSLVVAPAGPLLSLPFGVLLTGPADATKLAAAPWLVRRYDIAHVPSAANFVSLRKVATTSRATRPWFGFGDFRPASLAQAQRTFPSASCRDSARLFAGLPVLPLARRELDAAKSILLAGGSDELLGSAFTAKAVEATDLANYRVLHFAAHALLPAELRCVDEPAIVTSAPAGAADAGGALLKSSDVLNIKLDADLVILSACNSGGGAGGPSGGESLSGLARSFFYAGARTLLVTHWSVNDQIAAYLVASTIGILQSGGGVAPAMRSAELALLDGAGTKYPAEVAHPFYWAPFAVIGEGQGKIVSAGAPRTVAGL